MEEAMNRAFASAAVILSTASITLADLTFPPVSGTPVGPGLGFAVFSNPLPPPFSNDDVLGQETMVVVQVNKRFDAVATIDSPILINAHSAGGTPSGTAVEYSFSELVTNNTGVTWIGFEMELGEGLLAAFGPYANPLINVTFDVPNQNPTPICTVFPIVSQHLPHKLTFTGGTLAPGATMAIRFQIDNLTPQDLNFDGSIDQSDIYSITLREVPMIPAPGAMALGAAGTLLIARRRR
jgi:hypothetical protein